MLEMGTEYQFWGTEYERHLFLDQLSSPVTVGTGCCLSGLDLLEMFDVFHADDLKNSGCRMFESGRQMRGFTVGVEV